MQLNNPSVNFVDSSLYTREPQGILSYINNREREFSKPTSRERHMSSNPHIFAQKNTDKKVDVFSGGDGGISPTEPLATFDSCGVC